MRASCGLPQIDLRQSARSPDEYLATSIQWKTIWFSVEPRFTIPIHDRRREGGGFIPRRGCEMDSSFPFDLAASGHRIFRLFDDTECRESVAETRGIVDVHSRSILDNNIAYILDFDCALAVCAP
jgi:hypothetical protein